MCWGVFWLNLIIFEYFHQATLLQGLKPDWMAFFDRRKVTKSKLHSFATHRWSFLVVLSTLSLGPRQSHVCACSEQDPTMTDCTPAAGRSSHGQNFFIHICVVHHRTKGTWCCVAFTHSSNNNNNNCYSYEQIAKPIQANELKLLLGLTLTHTHANALLDAVTRSTQLSIANAFYALFREFLGGGVTTKRGFSPEK